MTPMTAVELARWVKHGCPVRYGKNQLGFLTSLTALGLEGALIPVCGSPVLGRAGEQFAGLDHGGNMRSVTVTPAKLEDLVIDTAEETYRQVLKMKTLEALDPQPQTCCRHATPYGYACPECDAELASKVFTNKSLLV